MAAVQSNRQRVLNRAAVGLVLLLTVIYLIPIYWISSTAFKPRSLATTVPPTVFFQPEVTAFVKLFTKRVQMIGAVDPEVYAKARQVTQNFWSRVPSWRWDGVGVDQIIPPAFPIRRSS
jgi:multiple sugar transport system permease protein